MTYTATGGWVEQYDDEAGKHSRFHARTDCPCVRRPDTLRQGDRLYSATRCPGCADEHGNNLERFASPPPVQVG